MILRYSRPSFTLWHGNTTIPTTKPVTTPVSFSGKKGSHKMQVFSRLTTGKEALEGTSVEKPNFKRALLNFRSAQELAELYYGTKHPLTGFCYSAVGDAYKTQGKLEKAVHYYKRAKSIYDTSPPKDLSLMFHANNSLAEVYRKWNKPTYAQRYLRESLATILKIPEAKRTPSLLNWQFVTQSDMAHIALDYKQFDEAATHATDALSINALKAQLINPHLSIAHDIAAQAYYGAGHLKQAKYHIEQAIALTRSDNPKPALKNPTLAKLLQTHAKISLTLDDHDTYSLVMSELGHPKAPPPQWLSKPKQFTRPEQEEE